MGLLNRILGQVTGGGGAQNELMNALVGLLGNQQSGGLAGLVEQFSGKGLGDIVNSWVGTGANLPISAQQIQQGLGKDTIAKLASQAGISTDKVSSSLSKLLPQFVDKLTPEGKIPQGDVMAKGMDLLKGLMK